jgi:hypothetical protein
LKSGTRFIWTNVLQTFFDAKRHSIGHGRHCRDDHTGAFVVGLASFHFSNDVLPSCGGGDGGATEFEDGPGVHVARRTKKQTRGHSSV